jgi:uncharacterized protein (TIGR02453 family)
MPGTSPFGPGLLRFLRELDANNDREWFQANRERYEDEVREPALEFIRSFAPHLEKISPYLVANDKKVGGSLMRIHRDVRFSKSKLPYKTNVGIQFRHVEGKDVHAPGLYFHVDPKEIFLGVGMWHPASEALQAVRQAIVDDPRLWKRVRDGKRFRGAWRLGGASLKRPPRGYPADHTMVEDLRRTDHIAFCSLAKSDLRRPDHVSWIAGRFRVTRDYLGWQARALGLPF